ncbi:MAG: GTP 3',8-cyclase MoaA [Bacteroidetes bacterium]|nr:GTP 3',8-cyclase MoaA [Bacteroidota bacterium]MBU2506852.1 GTP 3',8-cyclase MoaA [Bacteroidota bacterium]
MKLVDKYDRVHDYLRISLTDKCNYNCIYCNPSSILGGAAKDDLLSFEELLRLIEFFATKLEFKKFRFTGGEPLVRKGIFEFLEEVGKLKRKYGFTTGLTTNGSLLKGKTALLRETAIDNLNISLDSINKDKFKSITGKDDLENLLDVIEESLTAGYSPLKVNAVVIKGINDYEIIPFVEYFKNKDINLRFIEFMPFGSNEWERNGFISYEEIKSVVERKYQLVPLASESNSVAKDFQLADYAAKISFISSISEHFCGTCNRVRVSSKGNFRLCLFAEGEHGINFKELYRQNYSDDQILELIIDAINSKWEKHPEANELAVLAENNMMTIGG